jgi:hypothetical protein
VFQVVGSIGWCPDMALFKDGVQHGLALQFVWTTWE